MVPICYSRCVSRIPCPCLWASPLPSLLPVCGCIMASLPLTLGSGLRPVQTVGSCLDPCRVMSVTEDFAMRAVSEPSFTLCRCFLVISRR